MKFGDLPILWCQKLRIHLPVEPALLLPSRLHGFKAGIVAEEDKGLAEDEVGFGSMLACAQKSL
jgi:hypothetical protein